MLKNVKAFTIIIRQNIDNVELQHQIYNIPTKFHGKIRFTTYEKRFFAGFLL